MCDMGCWYDQDYSWMSFWRFSVFHLAEYMHTFHSDLRPKEKRKKKKKKKKRYGDPITGPVWPRRWV